MYLEFKDLIKFFDTEKELIESENVSKQICIKITDLIVNQESINIVKTIIPIAEKKKKKMFYYNHIYF
jgi:hypothetical protein